MNQLVIIGNGFDLAHGLKTSYNNFMLWYLKQALQIVVKKGVYKDKLIEINTNRSVYIREFQINNFRDFKEQIKSVNYSLKETKFFSSLIENMIDHSWVDIESEYYRHLVFWYNMIQRADKGMKGVYRKELFGLNEALSCIKEKLIEYFNSIELDILSENQTIAGHIDKLMESMKVRENLGSFGDKICFLNFNYTSTIDTYLKKYNSSEYDFSVINIHGSLVDIDSIIFGYGDLIDSNYENIENTHDNEYLKHIKHFYYFQRKKFHELIRFIESKGNYGYLKYDVHIMGHSCGVSDRMLLNRIFAPATCSKIKIYYHKISEKENDFFEKTQNISRHLSKENKRNMEIIRNISECKPLA